MLNVLPHRISVEMQRMVDSLSLARVTEKNHFGPIIPRLLLRYLPTGLSLACQGHRAGASGDRSVRFP
jgi:hypothetical protein